MRPTKLLYSLRSLRCLIENFPRLSINFASNFKHRSIEAPTHDRVSYFTAGKWGNDETADNAKKEDESDYRSYEHYLSSFENKA